MPRILVLNNYPLDAVWSEVKRKEAPDQLLFAVNYLERFGFDVEIVPCQGEGQASRFDRVVSRLGLPTGDVPQQNWVLARVEEADLIYSACQTQAWKLAMLRAFDRFHKPLVCLAHHPLSIGRLAGLRRPFFQKALQGVDAFPSLSSSVSDEINRLAGRRISQALKWGVDCQYYPVRSGPGQGFIAAGRTARDYGTFARAASLAGVEASIVCLESDLDQSFSSCGERVTVLSQPDDAWMPHPRLMELSSRARALAIPLYESETLHGLTGLMDALGLGKPVIMTRNPLVDLDIEKEGVGIWVNPGDVEGFKNAMLLLDRNPERAVEMGDRARQLAQAYSSLGFARQLATIFEDVCSKSSH